MGQVIAVTSGKGGTGKTTISAGIAECLAAEGFRVLCIDADVGLRNLDISLGMADTAPVSFADVLNDRYSLSEATAHPEIPGLWLLTAPIAERPEVIRFRDFGSLLETAREHFDYCVIDSPAGIGDGFAFATRYADRVLVIAASHNQPLICRTDRGAALGCLHVARRLRGQRVPLLRIR